jgi:hypothetical protein
VFKLIQHQSAGRSAMATVATAFAAGKLRQPLGLLALGAKALNRLAGKIYGTAEGQGAALRPISSAMMASS